MTTEVLAADHGEDRRLHELYEAEAYERACHTFEDAKAGAAGSRPLPRLPRRRQRLRKNSPELSKFLHTIRTTKYKITQII